MSDQGGYDIPLELTTDEKGLDEAIEKLKRIKGLYEDIRKAKGPAQRLEAATRLAEETQGEGYTKAQRFDAGYVLNRAQAAYKRAIEQTQPNQGRTMQSAFERAVRSTRFGMKVGGMEFMPLLGQMGRFAPMAVGAEAMIGAVEKLAEMIQKSVDNTNQFTGAQTTSGGTTAETAILKTIGASAGMSPEEAAAGARAFGERVAAGGPATSIFGPMGRVPGPYGAVMNPDFARTEIEAINRLINVMTDQQAMQAVRAAPELEPYLRLRRLPAEERQQMVETARRQAEATGPAQDLAARAAAQQARLAQDTDNFFKRTGADASFQWHRFLADITEGKFGDAFRHGLPSLFERGDQPQAGGQAPQGGRQDVSQLNLDPHTRALLENARATQELTNAVLNMHRDISGGGPRARGAVPSAWRGENFRTAMATGMVDLLGAFAQ